ncbi:MarR family winged helix-turn-helix transcriptional regulator [Microbacterium sp. CJ88]|uniref:MarR family winged helix-turn-helix transcriptional regulator n=1 Tax=Microbacterium sp. CJ88 TaxID=3445672 RepID=UPI003F655AB5
MTTPPAALARHTGFLLAWVAAESSDTYARAIGEAGFTPTQHGVLTLLDADGPQVQARLSERLDVFKPAMVGVVTALERAGWAQRRPHPTDGRAVEVHITDRGREALRDAYERAQAATDDVLGVLADDERDTLHALLAKVAAAR